jgi:hypothetical protein
MVNKIYIYSLFVIFLSINAIAEGPSTEAKSAQQIAAEAVILEMYNLEKELLNPFQTTQRTVCLFGKCSSSDSRAKNAKNTEKYLDLNSLYTDNLKMACEKYSSQLCQMHFVIVNSWRNILSAPDMSLHVFSEVMGENAYLVMTEVNDNRSDIRYAVICEENNCLIDEIIVR